MMVKLTFLGTSGSTPTRERSLSAVALEHDGDVLLFDCGEATQMQMMRYRVNISRIKAIFLTHIHGDHVIGIAGLVRTLALNKRTAPLYIFVPKGEQKPVESLIRFDRAMINYPIIIKPVVAGKVYSDDGYQITAFKLRHTVSTYGYSFIQPGRLRFIKQKCKTLGIRGTMFSELQKKGKIKVGNKIIRLKEVTLKVNGKKVIYALDSRPINTTILASKQADLLIHEATYSEKLKHYARQRLHSTAAEAAQVAKSAHAKKLVLTHISARYADTKELLKEAKKVFQNTVVAHDGLVVFV